VGRVAPIGQTESSFNRKGIVMNTLANTGSPRGAHLQPRGDHAAEDIRPVQFGIEMAKQAEV
jgi:hypothetical protein